MGSRTASNTDRARQILAQEAARIIVEQGIQNYRTAKIKAAERLGMSERGSLPSNSEIEKAVNDHLQLFGRESHADLLCLLRQVALQAMEMLAPFTPRLVGPVLNGTAGANSAINLHVFADSPEQVAERLQEASVNYRPYERRLKSRRDQSKTFAGFRFSEKDRFMETTIEATVFPINGMRQAPISPVDGKPMRRADAAAVKKLLLGTDASSN